MSAKALLCGLLLLVPLSGCEKTYRCGIEDRLLENRQGETGPPLCETRDGQLYEAETRP